MVLSSLHKYNKAKRNIEEIKSSHDIGELREAYYSFNNITREKLKYTAMNDELNALRSQMQLYRIYERSTKAKKRNSPAAIDNDEVSFDDYFNPNNESNSLQPIPIPQDYERPAAQDPQFISQKTYERPAAQYPQFITQKTLNVQLHKNIYFLQMIRHH